MVMIILFCNINGSTFGGGGEEGEEAGGGAEAFAIHVSLHDYIKSMFCHIWLMHRVFFKTGLKYEKRQKWSYYKEWSIFNNLLRRVGGAEKNEVLLRNAQIRIPQHFVISAGRLRKTRFVFRAQTQLTWKAAGPGAGGGLN